MTETSKERLLAMADEFCDVAELAYAAGNPEALAGAITIAAQLIAAAKALYALESSNGRPRH